MSLKTNLVLCTSCGKPTLAISKSWGGAGITSRPFWMITAALPKHWELCKTMKAEDVQRTIDVAMLTVGLKKGQRPRLLSGNGACYVASELKQYLKTIDVKHVHGKLMHPQTQGKTKTLSPFNEKRREVGSLLLSRRII